MAGPSSIVAFSVPHAPLTPCQTLPMPALSVLFSFPAHKSTSISLCIRSSKLDPSREYIHVPSPVPSLSPCPSLATQKSYRLGPDRGDESQICLLGGLLVDHVGALVGYGNGHDAGLDVEKKKWLAKGNLDKSKRKDVTKLNIPHQLESRCPGESQISPAGRLGIRWRGRGTPRRRAQRQQT